MIEFLNYGQKLIRILLNNSLFAQFLPTFFGFALQMSPPNVCLVETAHVRAKWRDLHLPPVDSLKAVQTYVTEQSYLQMTSTMQLIAEQALGRLPLGWWGNRRVVKFAAAPQRLGGTRLSLWIRHCYGLSRYAGIPVFPSQSRPVPENQIEVEELVLVAKLDDRSLWSGLNCLDGRRHLVEHRAIKRQQEHSREPQNPARRIVRLH